MGEFTEPIILRSPHERTPRVHDAQATLNGRNFFKIDWLRGDVDGDWGIESSQAADAARWELGYPAELCHSGVFGQQLFNYLRVDGNRLRLPLTYLVRRKVRLRQSKSVKAKALAIAISKIGITEHPAGTNLNPFGAWYGMNGVPWCAEGVTYCFVEAGDRTIFRRGSRSAWAYWAENMARAGSYGLRITRNPEPGDPVVYHIGDGHIEIFEKWLDRARGSFQTVGFNTSVASDDNGGAVMRRQRTLAFGSPTFVSYPS
jgi:hypothetical protein